MARTVFLSHSGADTAASDVLRKRLEGAGFEVWFDKRDLRAGHEAWQKQIETQIEKVDSFVVYVGTRGVVNWVEAETRFALSRAISGKRKIAFVPVLSAQTTAGSKALPGFARQFQAIRDVENDPVAWNRLITALTDGAPPPKEEHPFFHLRAIGADRNHLFFGRREETRQIVDILRDRNLVLVAGASGAGKSSLVRAGLIPAWRGNAVGVRRGENPELCDWLTITMTPGDDPWERLGEAVREAAETERGLSLAEAADYAALAKSDNAADKRRALRLNAEPDKARVLLVVDQFEELFVRKSITSSARKAFAEFLAGLADPSNPAFAVALTMRGDYTNQLGNAEVKALQDRLQAKDGRARFTLRSILMSDPDNPAAGAKRLREVVTGPLALAGRTEAEAEALADMVLRDAGGDAGDLALVQFALSESWKQRGNDGDDLLKAYITVGRVEGALVKAADDALGKWLQTDLATEADAEAALIRLGSLVGASPLRRTALRAEFTDPRWEGLQFLASEEGKRLVQITGEGDAATVEIAHEALLTQWPRLNGWLSRDPEGKRLLDGFAQRAREVTEVTRTPGRRLNRLTDFLLQAHGLEEPDPGGPVLSPDDARRYAPLLASRSDWLTQGETDLLERSLRHDEEVQKRKDRLPNVMAGWLGMIASATVLVSILMIVAGYFWLASVTERDRAEAERARAELNEVGALAGIAEVWIERKQRVRAGILALAALAKSSEDHPRSVAVLDASVAVSMGVNLKDRLVRTLIVDFTPDGQYLVTGDFDGQIRLLDSDDLGFVRETAVDDMLTSLAVSDDGQMVAATYDSGELRLWSLPDLTLLGVRLVSKDFFIDSVAISSAARRVATTDADGKIKVWSLPDLQLLSENADTIASNESSSIRFSEDGRFLLIESLDGITGLWDADKGELVGLGGNYWSDEILVSGSSKIIRIGAFADGFGIELDLWGLADGNFIAELPSDTRNYTTAVAVSASGDRIVTGDDAGSVQLFSGIDLAPLNVKGFTPPPLPSDSVKMLGSEFLEHTVLAFAETNIDQVAFSSDGRLVVSSRQDGTTWVWDAEHLKLVGPPLRGNDGTVNDIRFSPDGRYFITFSTKEPIIWDLSLGAPDRIARLCDLLAPDAADEIAAIEAEYGLTLPAICTPEQRAILLPPLYVPLAP